MKKIFWVFAALLLISMFPSCQKDDSKKHEGGDTTVVVDSYADYVFTANIDFSYELGYTGVSIDYANYTCNGKHLWEVFGYADQASFIAALGTADVSSSTSQVSNTVKFIAFDGSTKYVNEKVSTTNGWGHWFNSAGDVCSWGDQAYFFTEAAFIANGNLTGTLGAHPKQVTESLVGKQYVIIEGFETDKVTAAVEFHITVKGKLEAPKVNSVGAKTLDVKIPYDGNYAYTVLQVDLPSIASAIGVSDIAKASVYGVNADGSLGTIPGTTFWYDMDSNVASYSESSSVYLEYAADDAGTYAWHLGNYPNPQLAGKTFKVGIVFVNTTSLAGYYLTVNATIAAQDTWSAAVNATVDGPEQLADIDVNAVVAYLGYADVASAVSALQAGTLVMKPTNADGSYYLNADNTPNYSQVNDAGAKGVFYNTQGDCCNWQNNGGTESEYYGDFYGTMYYYSDTLQFCITPYAATEADLGTYAFKMDLVNETKTAHIIYNVTLESAIPWANYTVGEDKVSYNIKEMPNAEYKALAVQLDAATLCSGLGVADEAAVVAGIADGSIIGYGLNADGSSYLVDGAAAYTANGLGCWFDASGNVCKWGADGCSVFAENNKSDLVFNVGQFPEACKAGSSFTIKFKYVKGDKSVTETFNVSIVEAL